MRSDRRAWRLTLLGAICCAACAAPGDAVHLRASDRGFVGAAGQPLPAQDAAAAVLHTNPLGAHPFPLPRTGMPDGFGSKVEFQTVSEKDEASGRQVFHERLVRCGI